jgi:hypothetical protein
MSAMAKTGVEHEHPVKNVQWVVALCQIGIRSAEVSLGMEEVLTVGIALKSCELVLEPVYHEECEWDTDAPLE